ncbi:uncharacterized protein MONOS_1339 [Monocercomonoides exilis]|uniref:uncharacterized protein n=1 Tax=Monocercomonoides exilis TaxID=2049356 RepID=UPI00355A7C11|nr:hypothetical protein MONOS_1339 [Monocercomonoides exilis]|eukprot:MONOS_1339.1-p1 / transcript=MONOS_1339.1 / gene=MONOS_1339 / organism=Monocercomonoides_exilis_PA203 / gene_product=unspecified product / transcript_product=unspecified product / location=Mono_scaffold00023:60027-68294(+) / protein_length=2755 / sequence_SO=supercontig / SO=protein_coding / is_pseudo=false
MILSPCYLLIVSFLEVSASCELKSVMLLDGEDGKGKIKVRPEGKENAWWEEKAVECWRKEGKEKWLQTGSVRFMSRERNGVGVKSVNASVCLKRLKIFVSENVEVMNVGLRSLGEISECCVVAENGVMRSVAGADGGMVVLRNVSVEGVKEGIVFVGSLVRVGRCDGSDCGRVDLSEGIVRDVKAMIEGALIASCSGMDTVVEQMTFVNVSRMAMERQITGEEKREKRKNEENKSQCFGNGNGEKMIGCVVEGVEWPLDGGIVYGASRSGQNLWCENTTMERCERNGVKSNYEGKKNMERKIVSSGDETFVDCSFFETSATSNQSNSGGAILFASAGKLTVVRTSFVNCSAAHCGGAISSRFDEYCKMEVEKCNFTCCWGNGSGGAIDARYVSEGRWSKCRYIEGKASNMAGGLILEMKPASNIVSENEFVGNLKIGQAYNGGAGLGFYDNSFAIVTDCIFMNGYSEKKGGGICWDNGTGSAESKVLFCFFGNNSAVNGGSDVYICDGWTSIDEISFVLCRTISEGEEKRVVKGGTDYSGWVLKGYFSKIHIDGEEGIDHLGCGSGGVEGEEQKGRGCKRIGYFRMVADLTREVDVVVGRGRCKEEKVEIGDLSVSVKGMGKEETSVVLRGGSEEEEVVLIGSGSGMFEGMSFARVGKGKRRKEEFVVGENGGELQLVKCRVREASAEEKQNEGEEEGEGEGEGREGEGEAFLSGFVFVVGGRVVMESVEVSGMREDGCGVVETEGVNGGWVEMKNTVVEEVVRERGNGSVVGGRVGEGGGVVVEGGTYRNCGCLSGSGGWMWIGVGEGGVVSIGNTTGSESGESEGAVSVEGCSCGGEGEGEGFGGGLFVEVGKGWRGLAIVDVVFSGCDGMVGKSMFVEAEKLKVVGDEGVFGEKIKMMEVNDGRGYDEGCGGEGVPLRWLWSEFDGVGRVGGEGCVDFSRCGTRECECATVGKVVDVWFSGVKRVVEVAAGYVLREEIGMEGLEWEMRGSLEKTDIVVGEEAGQKQGWVIGVCSESVIRNMCFQLPYMLEKGKCVIGCWGKRIEIEDCSVGKKEIEERTAQKSDIGEIEYSFVFVWGGEVELRRFHVEGEMMFGEGSLIACEGEGNLVMKKCILNGVGKKSGKGGCVEVRGVENERKEHRNGDKRNEGEGEGEMEVKVIVFDECELRGCFVEGVGGCGGGICVEVGEKRRIVVNGSSVFCGCAVGEWKEERGRGGGLYIDVVDGGEGGKALDGVDAFQIGKVRFEGNRGWEGRDVFVRCSVLGEVADRAHLGDWFVPSEEEREEDWKEEEGKWGGVWGCERSTTGDEFGIPIVVYLWEGARERMHVDGVGGGDFGRCGFAVAPCETITQAIRLHAALMKEQGMEEIRVSHSSLIEEAIVLSENEMPNGLVIVGDEEWSEIVFGGEKRKHGSGEVIKWETKVNDIEEKIGFVRVSVPFSLTNIKIMFGRGMLGFQSFVLMESEKSVLLMKGCRMEGRGREEGGEIGFVFVEGMKGELKVEECVFKDCLLGREHLVVGEGMKSVEINGTLFSGIDMSRSSLIGICGGRAGGAKGNERNEEKKGLWRVNGEEKARANVRMEKSNFTSITSRGESGAVIGSRTGEVMGVVDVRIEGCEMRGCVNEGSEEGGGVKWRGGWEENGEGLVMESCTVAGCECSRTSGRGGGIMLDCVGRAEGKEKNGANGIGGFKMRGISFLWNEAFVGKDMFVRCLSIEEQMKRSVLELDTEQDSLLRRDAANASDEEEKDMDLLEWLRGYQSVWVYVAESGKDGRLCGSDSEACRSVSGGMRHMERGAGSTMWIVEKGVVMEKTTVGDVCIRSWKRGKKCIVSVDEVDEAEVLEEGVVCFVNESEAVDCVFEIGMHFEGRDGSVLQQVNGTLVMTGCAARFAEQRGVLMCDVMRICGGVFEMRGGMVEQMECGKGVLVFGSGSNGALRECAIGDVESEGDVVRVDGEGRVEMKEIVMKDVRLRGGASCVSVKGNGALNGEGEGGKMRMWCVELVNVSVSKSEGSVLHGEGRGAKTECVNCSFERWGRRRGEGSAVRVRGGCELEMEACMVDGTGNEEKDEREEWMNEEGGEGNEKGVCRWNESAVEVRKSAGVVMETRIANCGEGGMSASGGSVKIAKSELEGNGEGVAKYPSARRNMWCREGGRVEVVSLRGGDGMEKGSSMWMVNEGCDVGGILAARESVLFIPRVEKVEVEVEEVGEREKVVFVGELLLPCNLSFKVEKRMGEEAHVEKGVFEEEGYVSEGMAFGWTSTAGIRNENENAEVSVCILFGNAESPSSTNEFIVKNRSEPKTNGEERIVEGGKEKKSYWLLIVIIMAFVLLVILIVAVISTIRWRKVKNENKDLREIVNDTVKKDPKLIEMVTMEMSPEEQWRRAEREAEKKNEERIKKRVFEKSLRHSESSEHWLSECGSTEYILGKDSDKIPEWALEKVEEEETRKRTPSPSVSSTSTTDSDSTFVRGEDLCPTTSSMSNLVDVMACSSPHEKLIVDLRDSLYMLLHGRNEKKEMAIGSLQEREQTAAQVLFWVANLAQHSFDEMENPLQSLSNLSPHIVLFSERMVICIVMHSDFLSSDDDSDSSSISSTTVVTSASDDDDDDEDSLPSSAFEEDDVFKKECLRWKAPELQMNKKMGATKESVVFSIGMMLWECLTLQIPFGEFEAEVAGQKIVNGERPDLERVGGSKWKEAVKACVSSRASDRPTLMNVKRACIERFPANAAMLTVSDAIGVYMSGGTAEEEESEDEIGESSME